MDIECLEFPNLQMVKYVFSFGRVMMKNSVDGLHAPNQGLPQLFAGFMFSDAFDQMVVEI